jgi:hypothetical protein
MPRHNTPNTPQGPREVRADRARLTGLVLLLATIALVACTGAPSAYAGEWMQVSCVNPNLSAAPSQGWSSFSNGGGYGSNNSTSCGPGNPMLAILSSDAAVAVGSDETLQYTPPAGSTLTGGSVDVGLYADGGGYGASGTAVAYTPEYAYNGSNVFFQCAHGLTPCANESNDFTGVLGLPAARAGNLYLSAGCGGYSGDSCDEGGSEGAWSLVRLWWADLLLINDATPAASNITGTLLTPDARGKQELVLSANDPSGPGVYQISVEADGMSLYRATPDSNGGQCSPVGESDGALMFDQSQPCKQSESVDLQINTTSLHDGPHTLKITIQDAAGNSSVVYDGQTSTHNAPENTTIPAITPAQPMLGSPLTASTGEWSAPTGTGPTTYSYQWEDCDTQGNNCQAIPGAQNATYTPTTGESGHTLRATITAQNNDGASTHTSKQTDALPVTETNALLTQSPTTSATTTLTTTATTASTTPATPTPSSPGPGGMPNGTPASEMAILHLDGPATLTRSYPKRAFKLTGQLTNNHSAPIAGATLDVLQQVAGTNDLKLIAHATTSANGTFTLSVPPGPSRTITIAYRARSSDPGYAATARVRETVHASALLKVTPRNSSPTGTIILSGRMQGPVPPHGAIIELLVHYRGHWEPFRDPRTNKHGYFHIAYQFQGAIGRFPFRAQIPAGQAGYPYTIGYSNTVSVTTG